MLKNVCLWIGKTCALTTFTTCVCGEGPSNKVFYMCYKSDICYAPIYDKDPPLRGGKLSKRILQHYWERSYMKIQGHLKMLTNFIGL